MVPFAYFSPDPSLPLASTIVAVIGIVLTTGPRMATWIGRKVRARDRK